MEQIRNFRKNRGWTQEQLATAVGVKRSVISKYESGTISPSTDMLRKMADALGVEPWELMGYDGSIRVSVSHGKPLKESLDDLTATLEKLAKTFPAKDKLDWALPRLNDDGREKVADYAIDLTKIPEYRAETAPEPPPAPPQPPVDTSGDEGYHPGPGRARNAARGRIDGRFKMER